MIKGDFSNNGKDTFDESKQYIGIRLQQGVPLLDRDWNELEDIRRHFERMLRRHYIGYGVPDSMGFRITAPKPEKPNDFLIGAGRCMVNGYDVYNPKPIFYSEQPGAPKLPTADKDKDDVLVVYLTAGVARVDSTDDPDLLNSQDINMETCVRDKLSWNVRVTRFPFRPRLGTHVLAEIRRKASSTKITEDMIEDKRRTWLNLSNVVDKANGLNDRVEVLEGKINDIQLDIEGIKKQLSRLFWDVDLKASQSQALFGARVQITATVTDGLGSPVNGAHLAFSTDWGSLDPSTAVTNNKGGATVELVGVDVETPPPKAEIGVLQGVVQKVQLAAISNPGAIEYTKIRFEPQEMALISKFSPAATVFDLSRDLPTGPIVAIPAQRTATITVHAKESDGAIVRGVGNIQVRFGMWVRDWAKTKVWDIVSSVSVSTRVADLMRKGVNVDKKIFEPDVVKNMLPDTMQDIQTDMQDKFNAAVLTDPNVPDTDLTKTGILGQTIAQEATAAVGFKANQAITEQALQFESEGIVIEMGKVKTQVVQPSSTISAGIAHTQKQRFSSPAL